MNERAHRPPAWWHRPRWRFAAAAFLLGVVESVGAMALGFRASIGERDVTWVAGLVLEFSFAVFGYLIGVVVEARQNERDAAAREAEQLRRLANAEARLAQRDKLASLGQLASAMAHEVRNPLAILRSLLQNLKEDAPPGASRATCDEMIEEIDRLAHVTSTLVDFARPVTPQRARTHVAALFARVVPLATRMLEDREIRLEVEQVAEQASWWLDADLDLLCQVLLGLIENAADASDRDGLITVRAECIDDGFALFVSDRGPGIADADRERIFEPFHTTRAGGHGLGLAIARQMVEAHGGRIHVVPSAIGARLCVWLPSAGGEPAAVEEAS